MIEYTYNESDTVSSLRQKLYDVVCIADYIRTNMSIPEDVRAKVEDIVEVSDLRDEFLKDVEESLTIIKDDEIVLKVFIESRSKLLNVRGYETDAFVLDRQQALQLESFIAKHAESIRENIDTM